MKWRPKDWKNPYGEIDGEELISCESRKNASIFEAGADAMLASLFKAAKESPTGTFTIDSNVINILKAKSDE